MRNRNLWTEFLLLLRRNNMLCKKTQASYCLRLRVVTISNQPHKPKPCNAVNNADRRRNFTNFNKALLDQVVEAKSVTL